MPKQIKELSDIQLLVDTFYDKVRQDTLLAPVFEKTIGQHWPAHLEKMYRFWQTVLLEERTYQGSPFPPHAVLPLTAEHFSRWLAIFNATISELFEGEVAAEALWRANKMAELFQHKLSYFQQHPEKLIR